MADPDLEDFWQDVRVVGGGSGEVTHMDFTDQTLTPEQLREAESNWGDGGSITFQARARPGGPAPAMLELRSNGDIFVNGRLAENDREVVEALRRFLREAR